MAKRLRVAGIQAKSANGDVEGNLERASRLVTRAAERRAELVLCPEFLATGYVYDTSIWDSAEATDGPTERWLQTMATRHRIHIGASYLEASGEDFYNTFTLARPDGTIAGRVRKESLPFFEGWYFKSCGDSKVIDTDIGRIAVGICQDNHTARFMEHVTRDGADLLLMPHSGPCVRDPLGLIDQSTRQMLREVAPLYAETFGIPAVMVNKAEDGDTPSPIPVLPFVRVSMRFPGLSTICDADGAVLDQLGDEEGIVVADVTLDPDKRKQPERLPTGYWSHPPRSFPFLSAAAFRALEVLGKAAYAVRRSRARAARSRKSANCDALDMKGE